jgi:ribosomal protein L32
MISHSHEKAVEKEKTSKKKKKRRRKRKDVKKEKLSNFNSKMEDYVSKTSQVGLVISKDLGYHINDFTNAVR